MAELTIVGQKLIKTIKKEFAEKFPNLNIQFYSKKQGERGIKESGTIYHLDDNKRISEVRIKKPESGEKAISIHGRTLVGNLEDAFLKQFGIYVQVCYKIGSQNYYTTGDDNKKSLTAFNEYVGKTYGSKKK